MFFCLCLTQTTKSTFFAKVHILHLFVPRTILGRRMYMIPTCVLSTVVVRLKLWNSPSRKLRRQLPNWRDARLARARSFVSSWVLLRVWLWRVRFAVFLESRILKSFDVSSLLTALPFWWCFWPIKRARFGRVLPNRLRTVPVVNPLAWETIATSCRIN